jgi:hypothetical protein
MTDCCHDKTSPYEIRPEEIDLFAAAILFGDWLAELPSATYDEIAAIREMQTFLRSLPSAPPPDFNAHYGFRIETSNEEMGHFGWWSVSVCRAMLEVTCSGHENEPQFAWLLCPGWKNNNDLRFAKDWMRQVSDPLKLIGNDQSIVIQASKWSVVG